MTTMTIPSCPRCRCADTSPDLQRGPGKRLWRCDCCDHVFVVTDEPADAVQLGPVRRRRRK